MELSISLKRGIWTLDMYLWDVLHLREQNLWICRRPVFKNIELGWIRNVLRSNQTEALFAASFPKPWPSGLHSAMACSRISFGQATKDVYSWKLPIIRSDSVQQLCQLCPLANWNGSTPDTFGTQSFVLCPNNCVWASKYILTSLALSCYMQFLHLNKVSWCSAVSLTITWPHPWLETYETW